MKFCNLVLPVLISSVSAFTPGFNGVARVPTSIASSVLESPDVATTPAVVIEESDGEVIASSVEEKEAVVSQPIEEKKDRIEAGRYNDREESIALPFMKRPKNLDGTHAGDFGFDPLGLSEEWDLYTMQESEIRHGRLAMLAVIGWPMSELLAPSWMLQKNGCAPSVLNGFNPLSFLGVAAFFGAAGYFEYKTSLRRVDNTEIGLKHKEDMADIWRYGVAGDYNFDPLGLYSCIGDDAASRKGLRDVEISHGRSAMLGITAFAMWEYLTGHPVVENSMFFHPNLLLPSLVLGYTAASSVYEVDIEDNRSIKLIMTSEGEARVENFKMRMSGVSESFSEDAARAAEVSKVAYANTVEFAKATEANYKKAEKAYTEYAMRNIDSNN